MFLQSRRRSTALNNTFINTVLLQPLEDLCLSAPSCCRSADPVMMSLLSASLPSERVVERRHEQLQLFEGAAVTTDLHRLVLHHVAQVLQLLAARSALLVSAATQTSVQLHVNSDEFQSQLKSQKAAECQHVRL